MWAEGISAKYSHGWADVSEHSGAHCDIEWEFHLLQKLPSVRPAIASQQVCKLDWCSTEKAENYGVCFDQDWSPLNDMFKISTGKSLCMQ